MDAMPSTPFLTDTAPATLFVALELSRSTWLVAVHSPVVDKVSQHRLECGDAEGLLELITRKRTRAAEKLGRPVRAACCFEAGVGRHEKLDRGDKQNWTPLMEGVRWRGGSDGLSFAVGTAAERGDEGAGRGCGDAAPASAWLGSAADCP